MKGCKCYENQCYWKFIKHFKNYKKVSKSLYFSVTRPVLDRSQDCCKDWSSSWVFAIKGCHYASVIMMLWLGLASSQVERLLHELFPAGTRV